MKTRLLTFLAIVMIGLSLSAANLDLGFPTNGPYIGDDGKTVTFTSAWQCQGWWLNNDYSQYNEFAITITPTTAKIFVNLEYGDGTTDKFSANAGAALITGALKEGAKSELKQIYLQSDAACSFTVEKAELIGGEFDGELAAIPFDEYGNVMLSAYEGFDDELRVNLTLFIKGGEGVSTQAGWEVGYILPINDYDASWQPNHKKFGLTCMAISEEGVDNVYNFTVKQLKEFAKVDDVYFVDPNGYSGLSINTWGGAKIKALEVMVPAGFEQVKDTQKQPVSVEYYNMLGVGQGKENLRGVVIEVRRYSDGSVASRKMIK